MPRHTTTLLPILSVALLAFGPTAGAQTDAVGWHPAPAPLMTRWAKDVSPDRARPEYPRPNLVRKDWKSLNGLWQFAFDDADAGRAAGWASGHELPERILVPWTFEAALSGIGKGKEVHERVWYRRTFDVPRTAAWAGKRVLLHFGAVDWESTAWVNGKQLGIHRGGYTPFTYDITDALKPGRPQELVVAVYDPADPKKNGWQPKGKQLGSEGIWYTRTTGIWQTVWLEPVSTAHIGELAFSPKASLRAVDITIGVPRDKMYDVKTVVSRAGRVVSTFHAQQSGTAINGAEVPSPALWSPEHPNLYDVTVTLSRNGRVLDEVRSYFAFRTVGTADGRITLNGKPYFLRGPLDQGFWPDGIYTPPTDDAIKNDVVMTKAFGFNSARKHVKVEDPRWYYWCDRLGLLVAQDMPSSHNLQSQEAKDDFVHEWHDVVNAVGSHPCIGIWITFNEDWGHPQEFQDQVVKLTRQWDSTRPIVDASGWTQRALTDITDIHDYGNDLKKHATPNPKRATWIGEYGGVALPIPGHTWVKGWGYQTVKTPQELVAKYRFLTDQINNAPGLSGYIYTQLTDVEQELNGLMTYDRIPKAPPAQIAAINEAGKATARR